MTLCCRCNGGGKCRNCICVICKQRQWLPVISLNTQLSSASQSPATTASIADVSHPSSVQTLLVSATNTDAIVRIIDSRNKGYSASPTPITAHHVMQPRSRLYSLTFRLHAHCLINLYFVLGDHDLGTLMKMIDEAYSEVQ